jgi:hypothetical protein
MTDLRYHDHNELVRQVLLYLHANYTGRFWQNETGAIKSANNRFQRYGLIGSTDIIGHTGQGRAVYIEIKTKGSKLKPDQIRFRDMVTKCNCIHMVLRENYMEDLQLQQLQSKN